MRTVPDPRRIPYYTTQPPKFPPQMTTQSAGPGVAVHWHCAFVDAQGNGVTGTDDGHFHYIKNRKIQPSAGHTHGFAGLPCGAGGVFPMTTNVPQELGIFNLGSVQAAHGMRASLASQRKAQVRLAFARAALKQRGCARAQDALNEAQKWIVDAMGSRNAAGLVPIDLRIQKLIKQFGQLRTKLGKCR